MTERTLKYSHQSVCPAANPPQSAPKPKAKPTNHHHEIPQQLQIAPPPELTAYMQRLNKIKEKQEKYKNLASRAF